jgi:hypothetical protein
MARSPSAILYDPTQPRSETNTPTGGEGASERARVCEDSKDGHVVAVTLWPPKQRYSASKRVPSVSGVCERCGVNVIVYDPIQPGLRVKVPGGKVLTGLDGVSQMAGTKPA